eukprot:CAMPEP_0173202302 /NCGR_PEP_ID=MMETSP1141-20130122/18881_1 /TAXON_ID=483371 /ORGANISM="non described non described, Strain CCMP2298" /LENGTH=34 /DNA_ID= /DNA_START= /DNA_END= /DNA_ORIENTATION=
MCLCLQEGAEAVDLVPCVLLRHPQQRFSPLQSLG